jgi:UDP-glucuronate 4-epimerase
MNILVTGGAGFIGSHLCRALLGRGDTVYCIDNFDDYYNPTIKRRNIEATLEFCRTLKSRDTFVPYVVDILEPRFKTLFKKQRLDVIVHLAALPGVRRSVQEPARYFDVNAKGTIAALELARKTGARFILASSSSVYGNSTPTPFAENAPADQPLAPYPASKRAAEMLCHSYAHLHDIDTTVLRFFNVYGPAGRPDMMPMMVLDALAKHNGHGIKLYNDGNMWRDWTYVDDIVAGIVAAVDAHLAGYEILNLGCGEPECMKDFVAICEKLVGVQLEYENVPAPPTEMQTTYANISKARDLLGYNPGVCLENGLCKTWEWYKSERRHSFSARKRVEDKKEAPQFALRIEDVRFVAGDENAEQKRYS